MPKQVKRPTEYITVDDFVAKYGEAMRQTEVAKLLGLTPGGVGNMLRDGRLEKVAMTNRVLVRSVHAFLFGPRQKSGLRVAR